MRELIITTHKSQGPLDTLWGADLRRLELTINQSEHGALEARWNFGKKLLERREGKSLPRGLLDEVAKTVGSSRREIKYRMQFAARFPTKDELGNGIAQFPTWYQMTARGLAKTKRPQKKGKADTHAIAALREIEAISVKDLSELGRKRLDKAHDLIHRIVDKSARTERARA